MQQNNPPRRHAERDRGLDEGLVPERVYLGVDEAGEPRPIGDGQREDDVLNGRAERLRYGDGEDDLGNREEYVGDAHQRLAKPALPPSGDEADRNTDQERGPDRRDGDREDEAGEEQDGHVEIVGQTGGDEEIGYRWRHQPE